MDVEWEAVAFLHGRLQEKGPMTRRVLAGCLSQATEAIRETAGRSPEGVNEFVKSHPNTFKISKDGVISLPAKEISLKTQAVHFVQEILMTHGNMDIKTLIGHLRNAPDNVREVAGRNEQRLTSFISQHPMQFHISEDSFVDRTSKVFIDTVSATSCDDNAIILNVVDIFLANGICTSPRVEIACDLHRRVTCQIEVADLTEILLKSALFYINKAGDVIFKIEKLTEKVFIALFICAVLDEECTLSITELLAKIAPFELTKVVGLQTYYGLSKFLDTKMFLTVDGFVGLAESSEAQALDYVFKTIKSKNELSIQELTAELPHASEDVQDAVGSGISGIRAFLDDYESIFFISDDYVSLQSSPDVVTFFQQKLKSKGKIPLKDVHSYIHSSPENVKNVAMSGIERIHHILLSRKDVFSLQENDVLILKPGSCCSTTGQSCSYADYGRIKSPVYIGSVKKLQKLYGTIVVVGRGKMVGEEIYFNNKNCKFLDVGDDLTKFIQKGQILSFELEKGTPGGIYKWVGYNLKQPSQAILSKERCDVRHIDQKLIHSSVSDHRENEAVNFLSKTLKYRKTLHIQALTGHLAQASNDVRNVLGGLTEMRAFLEAHDDIFVLTENDNVLLNSSSECDMQDPVELLKNIVLLLLAPRKMNIHKVYEVLQKTMSKDSFLPKSIHDFRQIIKQYEIFRLEGDVVILKVSPSKGCISKTFGKNGFINKTYDNKDVYYRKSAVYIPPETQRKKKNSVIRERTWVKYIAVNVSSIPEKVQGNRIAPLRAILVWPKDGPDPGRIESKTGSLHDAHRPTKKQASSPSQLSDKQQTTSIKSSHKAQTDDEESCSSTKQVTFASSLAQHQYESTTSLSSVTSSEENLNPSDDHNELLKNSVLLLLQCGKMLIGELHQGLLKNLPKEAFLPVEVTHLLQILSQYDIFGFEAGSVTLKATPTKGCIAKTFGKNGIISKTKDNKDVYYRKSAIYIPSNTETNKRKCLIKERTRVMYIAVDVSALPEKIQGNRVAPLRGVLVWPKDGPDPATVSTHVSATPRMESFISEEKVASKTKFQESNHQPNLLTKKKRKIFMLNAVEMIPTVVAMSQSVADIAENMVRCIANMIESTERAGTDDLWSSQSAEIKDLHEHLLSTHRVLTNKTCDLQILSDAIQRDYEQHDMCEMKSDDENKGSIKDGSEKDYGSADDDNFLKDDGSVKDDSSNKSDRSIDNGLVKDNGSEEDNESVKNDGSREDNESVKSDGSMEDNESVKSGGSREDNESLKTDDSKEDNELVKTDDSESKEDNESVKNDGSVKDHLLMDKESVKNDGSVDSASVKIEDSVMDKEFVESMSSVKEIKSVKNDCSLEDIELVQDDGSVKENESGDVCGE